MSRPSGAVTVWLAAAIYLAAMSAAAFLSFAWDKWRAVRGGRRVRESTLVGLAAAGGIGGALVAMGLFRHKTADRKRSFRVRMGLAFCLWLGLAVAIAVWLRR